MIKSVDQLTLCLTRRCNMTCDHCLRGDAEAKDMLPKVIDEVFKGLNDVYINMLFFTGGEITCIPTKTFKRQLEQIERICTSNNIRIGSLGFVSNGKKVAYDFLDLITDFVKTLEIENFYISLSETQFHDVNPNDDRWKIKALYERLRMTLEKDESCEESYFEKRGDLNEDYLIKQGRALMLSSSPSNRYLSNLMDEEVIVRKIGDNEFDITENIYIGTTGNILACCDISYENEDEAKIFNCLDKTQYDREGVCEKIVSIARFDKYQSIKYEECE